MKHQLIEQIEKKQLQEHVKVRTGDSVAAQFIVKEGDRKKTHTFKGVVIAQKRGGLGANITIRKISHGVGVERVVQLHSPTLQKLEIIKPGKVRQSRIYYLRELRGKAMRIPERLKKVSQKAAKPKAKSEAKATETQSQD